MKTYIPQISRRFFQIAFFLLITINHVYSQTLGEAILYSSYDYVGTARMAGVGGAFGALGGDQGAIAINPASLGTYYKSEFIISPMFFGSSSETDFANLTVGSNIAADITFFNMGLVIANKSSSRSKWKTSNFAISHNKLTDFERNIKFQGTSEGSIVQRFAERANGNDLNSLDPFEAGVAYDALALIGPLDGNTYETDIVDGQETMKSQSIRSDGGMSELSLAWAGNYDDKIQLGFSLGIPFLNYSYNKTYSEMAIDEKSRFRALNYLENLTISGSGINFKAGIIAMPVPNLRIGASIASPSNFSLDDEYSTALIYQYIDNQEQSQQGSSESPEGFFSYDFNNPWRSTGSIAYLVKTGEVRGFVSAEIDYLGYTNSSYDLTTESNNPGDFLLQEDLNNQINTQLKNAVNFRAGGELAYDIYRMRAGFQLNGSPYYEDAGRYFSGFSLGAGLRFDKFFFDVAYKNNANQQGYLPFVTKDESSLQLVELTTRNVYIASTLGYMF
jgi:hypothetical protein